MPIDEDATARSAECQNRGICAEAARRSLSRPLHRICGPTTDREAPCHQHQVAICAVLAVDVLDGLALPHWLNLLSLARGRHHIFVQGWVHPCPASRESAGPSSTRPDLPLRHQGLVWYTSRSRPQLNLQPFHPVAPGRILPV